MADTRQPGLSMERFEALVAAYGADLGRFPERDRAAARELVARSPEARRVLEAARAFDALLSTARADAFPSARLEAKLAAIPRRHAQERRVLSLLPFRSPVRAALAAAAALLLGVLSDRYLPEDAGGVVSADLSALSLTDELLDALDPLEGESE